MAGVPSLWNSNITDFMINLDGQAYDAGWVAQTSTEDCLSLAIWTPRRARPGHGLPVALFVPGGVSNLPLSPLLAPASWRLRGLPVLSAFLLAFPTYALPVEPAKGLGTVFHQPRFAPD